MRVEHALGIEFLAGGSHSDTVLGHMVPCRVAGVAVGGRDLNWERIPLAEG